MATMPAPRAISSAGRAPARQAGGHWFEPSIAHAPKALLRQGLTRPAPRRGGAGAAQLVFAAPYAAPRPCAMEPGRARLELGARLTCSSRGERRAAPCVPRG